MESMELIESMESMESLKAVRVFVGAEERLRMSMFAMSECDMCRACDMLLLWLYISMHNTALIMIKYSTARPVYECQCSQGSGRLLAAVGVGGIAGITLANVYFY